MPSCDSLLFVCFALNSVETREGMPLLSFLDENRGNILVTLLYKLFCLINVFRFQFKVHRCIEFFFSFLVPNTGEPSTFAWIS